jgi:hypothetical protein
MLHEELLETAAADLADGRCYLRKEDQDPALAQSYDQAFDPD